MSWKHCGKIEINNTLVSVLDIRPQCNLIPQPPSLFSFHRNIIVAVICSFSTACLIKHTTKEFGIIKVSIMQENLHVDDCFDFIRLVCCTPIAYSTRNSCKVHTCMRSPQTHQVHQHPCLLLRFHTTQVQFSCFEQLP